MYTFPCTLSRPQDVDIVFAYATKYSAERGIYLTELSRKLLDLKSGAKVMMTTTLHYNSTIVPVAVGSSNLKNFLQRVAVFCKP